MACSVTQLLANRRDSQRSVGPKPPEEKARSREKSVKHGLTVAGIAFPTEDKAVVARRFVAIQEDVAPNTVVGMHLAHQIGLRTILCQRAARQESAALTAKILRVPAEWDEARAAGADYLMGWIGCEPVASRRQLVSTSEGIDRLIAASLGLKLELDRPVVWNSNHDTKLEAFTGRREFDIPETRGMKLSKAIQGDFAGIGASQYDHPTTEDQRRRRACDELVEYIEAEITRLEELQENFDHSALTLDRAESVKRYHFDQDKEATLAWKFEAVASREFHRALREFRAVETDGESNPKVTKDEPAPIEAGDRVNIAEIGQISDDPKPLQKHDLERILGSFCTPIGVTVSRDHWTAKLPIWASKGTLICLPDAGNRSVGPASPRQIKARPSVL